MRCHIYRKQNQSICETYSAEIKDFDSLRILGPLFMKVCNYYYSFTEVSTFRDQIKFSICVYEKTFPVLNSNEQKIVHCKKICYKLCSQQRKYRNFTKDFFVEVEECIILTTWY